MPRPNPPTHPLGPPLLTLVAVVITGMAYWLFGIGKDTLIFAVSVLIFLSMPVAVVFGVTGIVLGIRRLLRGRKP
jgi:hypothetical protein